VGQVASIGGLGSGLDTESIISQLMSAERANQSRYNTLRLTALSRQTAWSDLATRLASLRSAADALSTPVKVAGSTATSSDPTSITATAASGAQLGSVGLVVRRLASAQQLSSSGLPGASALVGAGTAMVSAGTTAVGLTSLTADGTATAGRHTVVVTQASSAAAATATSAPPLSFSGGEDLVVTLAGGGTRTATLQASYATVDALAADLSAQLGPDVSVSAVSGRLHVATRAEGSTATLSLSGTAAAALGLDGLSGTGTDGKLTVDGGAEQVVSALDGTGTLVSGGLTLGLGTALRTGTATAVIVRTDATTTAAQLAAELSTAGSPVSATVVDTRDGSATPARLVLTAAGTGSAGALTLTSSGLAVLESGLAEVRPAVDAQLEMGGLTVTRSSNTVTDLLPGVTLSLVKAAAVGSTTETLVTVGRDVPGLVTRTKALVDAANGLLTAVQSQTRQGSSGTKGGPLASDSSARALASSLFATAATSSGTGDTKTLQMMGISVTRSGSFSFDEAALGKAVAADPDGVAQLLSSFAKAVADGAKRDGTGDGFVVRAKEAAGLDATRRQSQMDAMDSRLATVEARYRRQFSQLDVMMSSLRTQSARLSSQIAGLY
jgi:flagellar hook-associated protein 2